MSFSRSITAAIVATLLAVATVHAQAAQREALLILRVLSYDTQLPERVSQSAEVTVLVVFRPGDSASETTKDEITGAINSLSGRMTVANKRPKAVAHPYAGAAGLQQAIRRARVAAVYVTPGLAGDVAEISNTTRAAHVLTLTPVESFVRNGLSVGLVSSGGRTGLLVNLPASRAEQARLDAALLRLATVIR